MEATNTTTSTTTTDDKILTTKSINHKRRLVLFPLPYQGHINPMLQLANILYAKAFSITILHTLFNSPNPTNYPHFTFLPVPGTAEEHISALGIKNIINLLLYLNENGMEPVKECVSRLMSEDEGVVCLITDAQWFATQKVADDLKLPRIVLRTSSIGAFHTFVAFPRLHDMGYFTRFTNEEIISGSGATSVPGLELLKARDLSKFFPGDLEDSCQLLKRMTQATKLARGIIWNTFKELEEQELETLRHGFPNPHFLIGPFHKYFQALSSSLLVQDQTSISWLDKHPPNSVLYVSFGSIAKVEESDFLEMAWGLANSKQPFLWVVRPGCITGSKGLELLPDGFLDKIVDGRGYIVKWAPQQKVLAHRATCAFWTHNGWNSTLESICEGVPMICSPSFGDQLTNARFILPASAQLLHFNNHQKMVKGRQGERVRLYTRGTILGYKRSKSNQYPNTSLVQIEGVNTKEEVGWYQGKRLAYIYKAKVKKNGSHYRCIWGKVNRPHGNTGIVRAKFKTNLPPKSMGSRVRVFMYPSNI